MTIRQLAFTCWELNDPRDDERKPHFGDQVQADLELSAILEEDPEAEASVRQLESPCWLAQCDGACGTVIDEEDEGVVHHATYAGAEETVRAWNWVTVPGLFAAQGDLVYCPEDAPEDGTALVSPAEQEAAGQLRLPGAVS